MKQIIIILLLIMWVINNLAQSAWPWQDLSGDDEVVTLLLMGDTNIQKRIKPELAYQHVLATLHAADVCFTNLEGPFAGTSKDPNAPDIPHKNSWNHSEPDQVKGLLAAGIDGVGVANNVTYPWQALLRSLAVLDSVKIPYVGGGNNLMEAHQPLIIEKNGVKFGFLQYTSTYWPFDHAAEEKKPGVATVKIYTHYQPPRQVLDKPGQPPIILTVPDESALKRMKADIENLCLVADIIVASYHWGISRSPDVVDYQRILAREAINSGADIVIGHGPHVLQPIEIWKNRPIFFSLGNFVFDWWNQRNMKEGILVRVAVQNKKLARVSFLPVRRDEDNNPQLLDPNGRDGAYVYQYLKEIGGNQAAPLILQGKEIIVGGITIRGG